MYIYIYMSMKRYIDVDICLYRSVDPEEEEKHHACGKGHL